MCNKGQSIFNVFLYFFVIKVVGTVEIKQTFVDIGKNLTISCPYNTKDITWVREGRKVVTLENGTLFLPEVQKDDSGIYTCSPQNVANLDEETRMNVTVRTPPPPLQNVVVQTTSIIALIIWEVNGTGGYPIKNFTAQYRLAGSNVSWIPISPNHITPNARQVDVYKLKPNTTYEFRIWATNQLGRGEITEVAGTTSHEYKEEEIARRMLAGADKFDTRIWAVAVGVVMGTLMVLGLGTCFLLYQECHIPTVIAEEQEVIELVPNIILNPGFDSNNANSNNERPADENCNNETPLRLNNNTVVQPRNNM